MTGGVCFVDTETTGLDPERHEIWEVGLIDVAGIQSHWFLPVDLSKADPHALDIGGYHARYPVKWQSTPPNSITLLSHFAAEFMALTWGHHLAGAVVSFDAEHLARLLRANDACPGWHYHLVDVDVRCNHETCRDRGVYQMVGYCKNCRTPDLLLLCTMTHEAPFNAVCPVCECAAVRATRLATTDEMCIPVLVVTPRGKKSNSCPISQE